MADDGNFDVSNLDGLAKIKAEQQSLRDLAARAADHRDKVTEVYTRVVRDYEARISALEEQAQRLRTQSRDDFNRVDARYAEARGALEQARFDLQESEFRKEIGEFSSEEFQRRQAVVEATMAEKQREMDALAKLRTRFLELLPPEPAATPAAPPVIAPKADSHVTAAAAAAPAVVPLPAPQPIVPAVQAFSTPAATAAGADPAMPATRVPPVPSASSAAKVPPMPLPSAGIGETMVLPPPGQADFRMPASSGVGETMVLPPPGQADFRMPPSSGVGETMVLPPPGQADFRMPPSAASAEDGATRILTPAGMPPAVPDAGEAFGTVAVPVATLVEERAGGAPITHRLGMLTTIGRTPDNQIVIPSREVSRKHAEIILGQAGYLLRDLGSPNGTYVNGAKVKERKLEEGDRITLAGQTFVFKGR